MRANDARPIAAAVAATWLLLAAVPPGAATAAAPDVTNAADEAAPTTPGLPELLEATEAGIREAMALESQVQAASGEQRDILVERGRVAWTSAGEKLRKLLEEIARLREAGGDVGDAREEAAGFLDQLARWNAQHVETLHAELERLRAARDGASAEELPSIEEELTQTNAEYDRLLLVWVRQCGAREELGLDARAECARVDELLTARADERSTQVLVTRKRILELTSKVTGADEEEAKRLHAEIASLEGRLGAQVQSLRQLADLMEARGLATAEYRGLLIETTGEITTDILSQEVALGLVERWGKDAKRWLVARAATLAFSAVLVVALLLGAHLTGRLLQRVAKRALQSARAPVSQLFQSFVLKMTYRIALGLGALVVLSQLGVAIGPLLAGLGFASFIVGFALQDTLSNFAAGMLILAYRPFDVGDEITAGGVSGNVEQMTLVTTTILTLDHQRLIVPNNKIWGDVITNITAERMRRVDLTFGIGYSDDVEHAEKVLHDIVGSHEKVLKDPAPVIKLHSLGESSVNFTVRPWAQTVDYWDVYWDITREVKRRFDAEGISIPFPQRDVHLIQRGGNAGNGAQASSHEGGSS